MGWFRFVVDVRLGVRPPKGPHDSDVRSLENGRDEFGSARVSPPRKEAHATVQDLPPVHHFDGPTAGHDVPSQGRKWVIDNQTCQGVR